MSSHECAGREEEVGWIEKKGCWAIWGGGYSELKVKFCPWCGVKLPDLRPPQAAELAAMPLPLEY